MRKIYSIIFLSGILFYNSFSQELELSSEPQDISSGAEYSIFLQQLINSGQDVGLKFNGIIPLYTDPNGIEAITTIEGINFDEDASNSSFYHIPPDPHGAAGPTHLVSVVNTSIEWFTKAGVTQNSQSLASFFTSLTPLTGTFDPKVIYDQYNDRFVVVTLERTTSPSNTSRIFVAVSQTSDPNSGWYFYSINTAITIGTLSWADYPGLAVSSTGIYITANMFSFSTGLFTGGRLWIIDKAPFYTGGVATSIVGDHITSGSGYNTTYQPTQMFGTAQTGVGTFLVAYSGLSGSGTEYVHVIRVSNSLTAPTFTGALVSLGDIDNTVGSYLNAPQQGTATLINTNDRRTQNAVWRNNTLWTTFTVVPNSGVDAGQVTAHWVNMNSANLASLVISDQGNIGGETIATGCYTFFPSIAVNNNDEMCLGFTASAPTIYPGCYYSGRVSTDPAGYSIAPDVVKAGLDYYVRIFAFNGGTRNRWGDYSGTCVDPSTQSFYVFNEYALTRGTVLGGEDGRWGTVFGLVPVGSLPVELTSFSATTIGKDVKLSWNTATEINNYGFEIERSALSAERLSWEKIGFVNGNGNSNSPKDYSFVDDFGGKPAYRTGRYSYRLKQIDNDGQFEYSKVVEIYANGTKKFELTQNYPNPFNPTTTIQFQLPTTGLVKLTVYNILGQEIKTLVNETKEAGTHTINFDASDLNSGVYVYKIESGSFTQTKKMTLVK
jgi:hypothetical protein